MKAVLYLPTILAVWAMISPGLGDARRLMEEGKPEEAAKAIDRLLENRPQDPWLLYNRATAAYASKDFEKADEIWQQLAGWDLPEPLREKVWTQIGNASFRLAEAAMEERSGKAIERLEQSREAYRVALAQNKSAEAPGKNLVFVEKRLELHYVDLAGRLVADAGKEPSHDAAIEKLKGALEYQRDAIALNPSEPRYSATEREILGAIADRYSGRGHEAEKDGDRVAEQKSLNEWNLAAAREHYDRAVADFREAQTYDESKLEPKEGAQRVIGKVAGMLTKVGRERQREGDRQSKNEAPEAFQSYEQALTHYDDALAVKPGHEEAASGRKEVLDAMEQLHLREGDKMTKTGERQIGKDAGEAVANLLGALAHFEQARGINPDNPEIPPRIERVRKLLPDVLVTMGQEEQKRAEEAEPKSIPKAVAHLEQAEAGYEKALQLEADHLPAKAGLEEVREDLARLRKLLAKEPPKEDEQEAESPRNKEEPSFASMLAQVRAKQEEQQATQRKKQFLRQQQQRKGNLRDW